MPTTYLKHMRFAAWLVVFSCVLFSSLASLAALYLYLQGSPPFDTSFLVKTAIKGFAFAAATLFAAIRIRRIRRNLPPDTIDVQTPIDRQRRLVLWGLYASSVAVVCVMSLVHLDRYPKLEPDEAYHLTVARNLAEYGLYASGHPDTGFQVFDEYDSVGPPVIIPVAIAFKLFGTSLFVARVVMALHYVALCGIVVLFTRSVFGSLSAALAVLLMTCAPMTTYLVRTLYGEVPALLYFLISLLLWRYGMRRRSSVSILILSGVFAGLAILCKEFLGIALCALATVLISERPHDRQIRFAHIAAPGVGVVFVILLVRLVKHFFQSRAQGYGIGSTTTYQHYFLFGVDSLPRALDWFSGQVLPTAALALGMLWYIPRLNRRKAEPTMMVVVLTALLLGYWWVFFTPAHFQRYLWFTFAIGAILAAPLLESCLFQAGKGLARTTSIALALLLLAPAAMTLTHQARLVCCTDEAKDERDLAAYVRSIPSTISLATTHWPLNRTLNFLAGRNVRILKAPYAAEQLHGAVIAYGEPPRELTRTAIETHRFGVYHLMRYRFD